MNKLIIIRHGDYDYGNGSHLNDTGRKKIKELSKKLQGYINNGSILLLTSPAARARESAEIISNHFNVKLEEHNVLFSDSGRPANLPDALELAKSRQEDADIILLVTHLEYTNFFPGYFAKEIWGIDRDSWRIEKGEACVIDCERKSLIRIAE